MYTYLELNISVVLGRRRSRLSCFFASFLVLVESLGSFAFVLRNSGSSVKTVVHGVPRQLNYTRQLQATSGPPPRRSQITDTVGVSLHKYSCTQRFSTQGCEVERDGLHSCSTAVRKLPGGSTISENGQSCQSHVLGDNSQEITELKKNIEAELKSLQSKDGGGCAGSVDQALVQKLKQLLQSLENEELYSSGIPSEPYLRTDAGDCSTFVKCEPFDRALMRDRCIPRYSWGSDVVSVDTVLSTKHSVSVDKTAKWTTKDPFVKMRDRFNRTIVHLPDYLTPEEITCIEKLPALPPSHDMHSGKNLVICGAAADGVNACGIVSHTYTHEQLVSDVQRTCSIIQDEVEGNVSKKPCGDASTNMHPWECYTSTSTSISGQRDSSGAPLALYSVSVNDSWLRCHGRGRHGVLLLPGQFSIRDGRIRYLADRIADACGSIVLVPQLNSCGEVAGDSSDVCKSSTRSHSSHQRISMAVACSGTTSSASGVTAEGHAASAQTNMFRCIARSLVYLRLKEDVDRIGIVGIFEGGGAALEYASLYSYPVVHHTGPADGSTAVIIRETPTSQVVAALYPHQFSLRRVAGGLKIPPFVIFPPDSLSRRTSVQDVGSHCLSESKAATEFDELLKREKKTEDHWIHVMPNPLGNGTNGTSLVGVAHDVITSQHHA